MGIKLSVSFCWLAFFITFAGAQTGSPKTVTDLNAELNVLFPNNTVGAITPFAARQMLTDIIASYGNLSSSSDFTAPPTVPTAPLGTNNNQAASTAFVQANGGGTFLNNLPPFTTVCNATGITAVAQACPAITAVAPLGISGTTINVNTVATNGQFFAGAGNLTNTAGTTNIGIGPSALVSLTTGGGGNVAIGSGAGALITSGANNFALGGNALAHLTTASSNVAIGPSALTTNVTGQSNVAIGVNSLLVATAGSNTAVGQQSGVNLTSGGGNTFIGTSSGGGITTGGNNSVFGGCAGLAGALANAVVICDGAGTVRFDWAKTTAATMTLQGPVVNVGTETATAHVVNGAVPTGNTGTCSTGITVAGGATAGTWTSTAICALAGTIILTSMPAMPTGYACFMSDRTTAGIVVEEQSTTVTSVTFVVRSLPTGAVATVANDILQYSCVGY